MVKIEPKILTTLGIYTPQQAARYARVATPLMKRWVYGDKRSLAAIRPQIPELGRGDEKLVTFLDLVQTLAVRSVRKDERLPKRVPLQRIRDVVDKAASEYDVDFPLARRHTIYLFEDDIVLRLQDDTLIQLTGRYKKHHCINKVIELYADDLYYAEETGMAERYVPIGVIDNPKRIELNPNVRFGEPVVYPSGYGVDALVNAVLTEGDEERAARVYGIERGDVRMALEYNDWLLGIAA